MTEAWKQWEGHVVDGRFTLREFQGSSDHSAVFLTNYGPHAQNAAIKFVEATPANAQTQLSRWQRAAQLSHPHLIRVLDSGRCQLGTAPFLYVITEFAEENLAQILPSRALSPSETEVMLRSMLEALAYLHGQGLAHGRLKPSNVMAVGDDLRLSSDGVAEGGDKSLKLRGSTVYDPPELATGGPSPAGDIWSLGVVLVEALTQRPADGKGIRQGEPVLPESIPSPFLEIARQCLRLDPTRRWTVPEIAARLLPHAAPPSASVMRPRYIVAAIVVLVAGALLAGPRLLRRSSGDAPVQTPTTEQPATPGPAPGEQARIASQPNLSASPKPAVPHTSSKKPDLPRDNSSSLPAPAASHPAGSKATTSGSASGAVAERVLPTVSHRSLNTITGKVRVGVRLSVDSSGRVVGAKLESPGPSEYFAKVALDASRRWKFTPPQVNGEASASQWILRYAFGRGGVEVNPAQVSR